MRFLARCFSIGATLCALLTVAPVVLADEASDRASLEAAAQAWIKAFNARDLDALAAHATMDVVLMDAATSTPVSGRAAARDLWARALPSVEGQVTSTTKEAVIAGDIAWRIGALAGKSPNGTVTSRGQSLEIWKRAKGEWQLHRQMSSGLLAPVGPSRTTEPVYDKPTN